MSSDLDPTELEEQRQREADKLQSRSNELGQDVEEVSQDWHRKRSDESVPGAPQHEGEEGDEAGEEDDEAGEEDKDDDEDREAQSG